jgi:GT2 family glycosyltransferase
VTQTHGPAAARNLGWRTARGAVIAFTDDDCLPDSDWLPEGLAALKEDLAAVTGRVIVPTPNPPTDYEKNVTGLNHAEFVTANCFCHRWALEAVDGFDESFPCAWREDSDLQFKMLRRSYRIGCAPNAKVIHPVRPAPWGVSMKEQRKSMFDALLYKKHPGLYRQRIKPNVLIKYYAIVFSLLGILFSLLIHNVLFAVFFSFVWMSLTLQFALQRLHGTKHTLSHIAEMLFTSIVIPPLSVFWRLVGAVRYRVWFF